LSNGGVRFGFFVAVVLLQVFLGNLRALLSVPTPSEPQINPWMLKFLI
jgi:hypothetical protein